MAASMEGWWVCSACKNAINPGIAPSRCPICSHYKCSGCYVYPYSPKLVRQPSLRSLPRTGQSGSLAGPPLEVDATELIPPLTVDDTDQSGVSFLTGALRSFSLQDETEASGRTVSTPGITSASPRLPSFISFAAASSPTTVGRDSEPGKHAKGQSTRYSNDRDDNRTPIRSASFDSELSAQLAVIFASDISDNLEDNILSALSRSDIADLVKDFSMLLLPSAKSVLERTAASVVRHCRYKVVQFLQQGAGKSPSATGVLAVNEKLDIWWRSAPRGTKDEGREIPEDVDLSWIADEDTEIRLDDAFAEDQLNDFSLARKFLTENGEFTWLLSRIIVSATTTSTGEHFSNTRARLASAIGTYLDASFTVDWSFRKYFWDQYNSIVQISNVICIVGTGDLTMATTCGSYIRQMWPRSGERIMKLLDSICSDAIRSVNEFSFEEHDDDIEITLDLSPSETTFILFSISRYTLLEAGEIVCWISVACRASPDPKRLVYNFPKIFYVGRGTKALHVHVQTGPSEQGDQSTIEDSALVGRCWHLLFSNPCVVAGYPIPKRHHNERGLQIPLELIVELSGARRATTYNGFMLLKGACSLCVPTLKTSSSIVWHYLVDEEQEWMSHERAKLHGLQTSITYEELHDLTHFVGWTRSVEDHVGLCDLCYHQIKPARSEEVGPGCALDGITVGVSKLVQVSTQFVRGNKDSRLFPSHDGPYPRNIEIASAMQIVLYDVDLARAWLVDGASALLLLARTALSSPYAPGLSIQAKPPVDQFAEAMTSLRNTNADISAKAILLHKQIRKIVLYGDDENTEDLWFFEKLILELWDLLDEMRSRQARLKENKRELQFDSPLHTRLEGFDFVDIISCNGPLRPKYADLSESGSIWLDFTTKIGAINILGSNFGQLMRPKLLDCNKSIDMPSGADFLAVGLRDLEPIVDRHGERGNDYVELVSGLFWYQPHTTFGTIPCPCLQSSQEGHCGNIVTELDTSRLKGSSNLSTAEYDVFEKFPKAAIILGRSSAWTNIQRNEKKLINTQNLASINNVARGGQTEVHPTHRRPKKRSKWKSAISTMAFKIVGGRMREKAL